MPERHEVSVRRVSPGGQSRRCSSHEHARQRSHEFRSHGITRAAALVGTIGASLGLAAGLAELTFGPSIRSWVGNKADTTRLGLATVVLAALALVAALVLLRRPRAPAPVRLALAAGLLIPGLICFTTVGRLWYVPGVLLVGAGIATVVDLRKEMREVATTLGRNWTAVLTVVLGAFYVFLGATALGLAGILGILGGLLAFTLVAARGALPTPVALGLLLAAALPFAALTWWSVATPLIGLLLLALGALAVRAARRPAVDRYSEDRRGSYG